MGFGAIGTIGKYLNNLNNEVSSSAGQRRDADTGVSKATVPLRFPSVSAEGSTQVGNDFNRPPFAFNKNRQ
jgi:hypothetical protein